MSQLSGRVVNAVLERLDATVLTRHSFDVVNPETTAARAVPSIDVLCKDYPEYVWSISYEERDFGIDSWAVRQKPDFTLSEERHTFYDSEAALQALVDWVGLVVAELQRRSLDFGVAAHLRMRLSDEIHRLKDPDKPFLLDEARQWQARLDEATKQLEETKDKLELTSEEIDILKIRVQDLKEMIDKIPKQVWVRSAGNAFLKVFERVASKVVASVAEGTVKALLPP